MPVYNFKCNSCNNETSQYIMQPPHLSGGEKSVLTCCEAVMSIQDFIEPNYPVGVDNINLVIKTSDYTERLQKMAVERAKQYKKQEADHRIDYKKRKFGL